MDLIAELLRCIGVALAGGLSWRTGHDKAFLSWQGRPLNATNRTNGGESRDGVAG